MFTLHWFLPPANEIWSKVMFYTCVSFRSQGGVSVPACITAHMTGGLCLGVSVWDSLSIGVSVKGVSVWGVSVWGVSVQGVSVQTGVSVWGVSVGRVSVREVSIGGGSLSREVSVRETPPYGNKQAVHILLECILVHFSLNILHFWLLAEYQHILYLLAIFLLQ